MVIIIPQKIYVMPKKHPYFQYSEHIFRLRDAMAEECIRQVISIIHGASSKLCCMKKIA